MLTVITLILVGIFFVNLGIIDRVRSSTPTRVNVVRFCGHDLSPLDFGIPVEVQNTPLSVEINR